MRPLSLRITFELILGAVLVASLVIILRQSQRLAEYQRHQEADAQSLRLLRAAYDQKDLQKPPPAVAEEAPAGNDHAGITRREAVIERLDRELAETRATMTDLQTQLSTSNDQNTKALATAEESLQKQQADAQAQLQDLQKKLDAALAQADIARQRVAALEADNGKLMTDTTANTTRAADVARTIASLQDLDRRRDVYLTSILRRYRDITGEFSAMSSMLDTSHQPSSSACSGAVLSRIQNAVTSVEDDLRQLNELNARSQKLEKQLLKK
jgi:DNA repair exonuclease SbcCD ATPase subunit